MIAPDLPQGQPFSYLYLRPTKHLPDSKRFRIRLASAVRITFATGSPRDSLQHRLAEYLRMRGLNVLLDAPSKYLIEYVERCDIRDALDLITFAYEFLGPDEDDNPYTAVSKAEEQSNWRGWVARIFEQEHLAYRIDERGGVHPLVDQGFEMVRASVIAQLSSSTYEASRTYFEKGLSALEDADTRGAIKNVFDSAEQLFMMFAGSNKHLAADTVRSELRPSIDRFYEAADQSQRQSASHMLSAFEHWVHAGHKYRHANKDSEPHEPQLDFAIAYLSAGMTYLRWLASIHGAARK